jgi:hypothetical protein
LNRVETLAMTHRAPWFAFVVVALTACAHRPIEPPVGLVSDSAPPCPIEYAIVPAGATFRVALAQPLLTAYTLPGAPFAAIVVDKLVSREGRVVVPAGMVLRGRIAGVELGPIEAIYLDFDSIQTVLGATDVHATVLGTQRFRDGVAIQVADPVSVGYDAAILPPSRGAPASGIGGGPLEGVPLERRMTAALPAGAQITLALRRPIVVP